MALIDKINGNLLVSLSGSSSSSRSSSSSSIPSADAVSVDLSIGVRKGGEYFASSYNRLVGAAQSAQQSLAVTAQVEHLVSELKDIAERAAESSISVEERARLNTQFNDRLIDLSQTFDDGTVGDVDLLSITDLKEVLGESGVSTTASTKLAQEFSRLGGTDGSIGFEKFALDDGTKQNPLLQDLDDQASAETANAVFEQYEDEVASEVENLERITDELLAGAKFSIIATNVFSAGVAEAVTTQDADELANDLVRQIKRVADDTRIAEHSNLDTTLYEDLLG